MAHLGWAKDGFSALVNYHRLDRATLEKLTYTYLGWMDRAAEGGVRTRCAGCGGPAGGGAWSCRRKLEMILEGEPPYDIYVRWKDLA